MIFKIKTLILTVLIQYIVKHPEIMESKLFLKAMLIFPEKISKKYDAKIINSKADYHKALEAGLGVIDNDPKNILDLCSGTGIAALKTAKFFPNAMIDAVDQSDGMINIAQNKAAQNGIKNIQFKKGNAVRLEYKDEQFDFIVTSNTSIYLSEAVRILKLGGLLLAAYSFGGYAFIKAKKSILNYIHKNNLELLKIKNIGSGAYILCKKNN